MSIAANAINSVDFCFNGGKTEISLVRRQQHDGIEPVQHLPESCFETGISSFSFYLSNLVIGYIFVYVMLYLKHLYTAFTSSL